MDHINLNISQQLEHGIQKKYKNNKITLVKKLKNLKKCIKIGQGLQKISMFMLVSKIK